MNQFMECRVSGVPDKEWFKASVEAEGFTRILILKHEVCARAPFHWWWNRPKDFNLFLRLPEARRLVFWATGVVLSFGLNLNDLL